MLDELRARMLLAECTGDDIWNVDHCRRRGVPDNWIAELCDAYESGFVHDKQTIHYQGQVTNQFEGVRDVDLAHRLATYLGVDVQRTVALCISRAAEVRALQEAAEEL